MALSGYQTVQKLSVDNSLAIWFLEDNPNYRAYIDLIFKSISNYSNLTALTQIIRNLNTYEEMNSILISTILNGSPYYENFTSGRVDDYKNTEFTCLRMPCFF